MMDFMTIEQRIELLNALKPLAVQMSLEEFLPFVCMITEEYCLAWHLDVCEMADQMQTLIHEVNIEQGRYGYT